MAPKKDKTNVKTKAKGVVRSTSTFDEEFDQIWFHTLPNAQKFETLVKYRCILSERQINLDELDPFFKQNLESRSWLPLCSGLVSPATALIRELYSNLSVDEDICHGHKLTSWICGVCFTITRDDVSNALYVPIICRPTYPCS